MVIGYRLLVIEAKSGSERLRPLIARITRMPRRREPKHEMQR